VRDEQNKGKNMLTFFSLKFFMILLISFSVSYFLTPAMRLVALKFKCLDHPNYRKIHSKPMPLLGGVAIYIACAVSILWNFEFSIELKGIAAGATIILIMGAIDDRKNLPAGVKLMGQIAAASIVIFWGGLTINFIPHWPAEKILEIIITYVWIIGITNTFNFLDGVDGLAAGLGIISGFCFFVIAYLTSQSYLGFLSIALVGACAGFLRHNWKPAKIFLGDGGSNFIGFVLAGLAVLGGWSYTKPMVAMGTPLLILTIPIFDMIYITASRIKNKQVGSFRQWIEYVGKDHFHHRLMNIGFGQRGTVLFIYFLSLSLGISAIVINRAGSREVVLVLVQAIITLLIITSLMIVGRNQKKVPYADN
jgi:UDP-GlcNAc:undecaprenyl-phosphate/decaprenyl-phosphate GlcNAc-1-phosphate transferase